VQFVGHGNLLSSGSASRELKLHGGRHGVCGEGEIVLRLRDFDEYAEGDEFLEEAVPVLSGA
jgi:hypothetical protein